MKAILSLLLSVAILGAPSFAESPKHTQPRRVVPKTDQATDPQVERVFYSLVRIVAFPDDKPTMESIGTGFFINQYQIITNAHVVQNASKIIVYFYKAPAVEASISIINPELDVACLEVSNPPAHQYLPLRDTATLSANSPCVVLGFPNNQFKATGGVLLKFFGRPGIFNPVLFQMSAQIDHGNSGGPVLDANGNLIGMATMGNPQFGTYYAISTNAIAEAVNINHYHSGLTDGISVRALEIVD